MKFLWSKSRELLDFIPKQFEKRYWIFIVKRRPWVKWALAVIFLSLLAVGGFGYWYMYKYNGCFFNWGCLTDDKGQPLDLEKLARSDFKKASYVYADNGEEIGKYFDEIRDPARLDEIRKLIQDAFVAAEDKRFYQHSGIDVIAITSAFIGNKSHARGWKFWTRSGGASTITQQLSRLIYANEVADFQTRTHTYGRKLKEARLAIRLEKRYSKKEILETYLNFIWLGHGANGVVAGSMRYWGKDIRKEPLTIREAAILAGINKNATLYDPIFQKPVEPKIEKNTSFEKAAKLREEYEAKLTEEVVRLAIAKDRYNFVLEQMKDNGSISQKEYQDNLFQKNKNPSTEKLAILKPWKNSAYGYSNRMVKEVLLSQSRTEKEISQTEGLRIYTGIDSKMQRIFTEEFEKHLKNINDAEKLEGADRIDGAFVVMEVKTGNILALSGGHDFNETPYNRVFAARSPGSGFKPFVYAAALEAGKDYFDKVCNCPFTKSGANGKPWSPKNFPDKNPQPTGYIDLARGVIWSLNLETLNLAQMIGMPAVIRTSNGLGLWGNPGVVRDSDGDVWFKKPGYEIRGGLDPGLPTAIGASGINLIELANAYTVFFRNGKYVHPVLVKEIRNVYGDLLFKADPSKERQVLSEETAAKMLGLMRVVTKIGTAKISMRNIEQQVACKTGTSNGPKDVSIWCGTPEIFIGIRLGHDDYDKNIDLPKYMKKVSGDAEMLPTGGWLVGPLARKIIDRIYANRPKVNFSENIEDYKQILLDRYSGAK